MDLGLQNKVALVTGGSRGLGRATADALLREGANVLVLARPSAELEELGALHGERCRVMAADVTDAAVPQAVVDAAVAHYGRLDVVVVNTPGPRAVLPLEASDADCAAAFDTAFYPAFRLIGAARPVLQANGGGRIVVVSSTSVKAPKPALCLSAAARSALWAWAKSAAPELYEQGITINAMFAGPHDTARARELGVKKNHPMGRADDFGNLVASLCGDASRFVTGTGMILDGGELRGI